MTWCSTPAGGRASSGVLIVPPVGYQWWSTHRTLRTLAERLAAAGHLVARLDHHGTGDSVGDQWEPGRVAAWRAGVAAAVGDLRAQGCSSVTVVGVRLGATLAVLDGAALGLDALALWAPVTSGRRWAREIRMLAQPVPDDDAGAVAAAGTVFSAQTLAEAGALSALDAGAAPAARVLIADARPDAKLADHLAALGCAVDAHAVDGGETALDAATEEATVPETVVGAIADWLGPAPVEQAGEHAPDAPPATAALAWRDGQVEERAVRLGDLGLAAIVTTGLDVAPTGRTLLFLNTGSEPHVGPGRAWVELARTLALDGHTCVRADWRGWGESPDGGAPGRPYDEHAIDDTIALVRALRADGHRHVTLVGLCASAWVALQAVLREPVDGVIALNPQMYWNFGDPIEATLTETRRRRTEEIAAIRAGADSGRWDEEDRAGSRPREARWLDDLAATGIPTTLLFAEGDDGFEFLTDRLAIRLAEAQHHGLVVRELPQIDHPLHRVWARDIATAAITDALAAPVTDRDT
ncbi:alpha/beta fold hydrolase [Conexibacter woesei]|uniref:alpha/beta fold hydrolase n=1 Tax=Conexibacter woesei TaxID=191495 RepID=UPI00040AE39C|nr:alpha/beta fold hydrolase [Conexibacter woesei]